MQPTDHTVEFRQKRQVSPAFEAGKRERKRTVQRVVVVRVLDEKFGSLIVATRHADVELLAFLRKMITEGQLCAEWLSCSEEKTLLLRRKKEPSSCPRQGTSSEQLTRMIELGQSPINQPQLSLTVVDQNIQGLYIPVNDPLGVAEVEGFEELVHVVALSRRGGEG